MSPTFDSDFNCIDMKWLFTLFILTSLLLSCDNDDDIPPIRSDSYGTITMKVDGKTVVMKVPFRAHYSGSVSNPQERIAFEGVNCDLEMALAVAFFPEMGVHDIALGQFKTGFRQPTCFKSDFSFGDWHTVTGNSNITAIGERIKGTFECTAVSVIGVKHTITDGVFDVEMGE